MPVVNVKIIEGRTVEQKREMVKKITQAIVESIGVPAEAITISIEDMKKENYAQAGVLRLDKDAQK